MQILLNKDQLQFLNKLGVTVNKNGEYRYIPFFFKKVTKEQWGLLSVADVPRDVIAEIQARTKAAETKSKLIKM